MSEQKTRSSCALVVGAVAAALPQPTTRATISSTRTLSQLPTLDLELTMHTPHDGRCRRGPACPRHVRSPVRAISNSTPSWRPLVARVLKGGQGPAVQTSFPMIGRFHCGADQLLRM